MGTGHCGKDVMPHLCLILLVGSGARTVDRENANVVSSQTPDGKRATHGSNSSVGSFEHTVRSQNFFILTASFLLNISDARCKIILVESVILGLLSLNFFTKLGVFVTEPIRDLFAPERNLAGPIFKSE